MTDYDFLDGLSHRREFYSFAKRAGAAEALSENSIAAAAALGALAGIGLQYYANRPGKTGKSVQRRIFERSARVAEMEAKDAKKEGRELSAMEEARATTAPALARLSSVAEKHPFKFALPALLPGMSIGAGLARAFK